MTPVTYVIEADGHEVVLDLAGETCEITGYPELLAKIKAELTKPQLVWMSETKGDLLWENYQPIVPMSSMANLISYLPRLECRLERFYHTVTISQE